MTEAQNPVRRHVRRVDIWAVTKVALLFFAVVGVIWLVTALVIWRILYAFDLIPKLEELSGQLVGGDFRLRGSELFRAFFVLDLVWVLGSSVFVIILAVVYNLIADVVGGITFVVEDKVPKRDHTLVAALRDRVGGRREKLEVPSKKAPPKPSAKPAAKPTVKPAATGKPGATTSRRPVRPAALQGKPDAKKTKTGGPAPDRKTTVGAQASATSSSSGEKSPEGPTRSGAGAAAKSQGKTRARQQAKTQAKPAGAASSVTSKAQTAAAQPKPTGSAAGAAGKTEPASPEATQEAAAALRPESTS